MTDFADGMGQKVSAHRGPVDDKQKSNGRGRPLLFQEGYSNPLTGSQVY